MSRYLKNLDPDKTVTSQEMEHQLDACDPLACVLYSHSPSVQVYYALRSRLESSSEAWLQEFVSLDGLDSLLDSLGHMTGPKYSGFSDAILQIDCLSCIRVVLNSRVGMETLLDSEDGVSKLLKGMDLANTLPRKHVLEVLSAVCVYSKLANKRLMEALDRYRQNNHLYHRFSFIVNELKMAETIPHKTAVLTFVNSIICSTNDRARRCRIRNEFVGLTLLDVLSFLQREDTDEDLYIQLQVFQEKKHEDESVMDQDSNLDLSSPQDLADAIQTRVFGGSKMVSFVNILQDLLAIETLEKEKGDFIWRLLERHVRHIVHGNDDVDSLSEMATEATCQAVAAAVSKYTEAPTIGTKIPDCDSHSENTRKDGKFLHHNSGSAVRKDGLSLKTSADSGYLGYEEKLSPPDNCKRNDNISNSQNTSPMNKKHSGCCTSTGCSSASSCNSGGCSAYGRDTNKKVAGSCMEEHILNKQSNNDASDYKCKTRQTSLYDNMSPVKKDKLPPRKAVLPTERKFGNALNNLNTDQSYQGTKTSPSATTKIIAKSKFVLNVQEVSRQMDNAGSYLKDQGQSEAPRPQHVQHNYLNYQRNRLAFPANVMRNLKWIKLDQAVVDVYPHSLWANIDACKPKIQPDFQQVEEMFRENYIPDDNADIPLLSNKARLNLNLFLNRLDEEPTELVKRLVRVDGPGLPLPFIKHLVEILPEHDEIKHLKYYNGNLLDLGQAEQFVLHLSDLPDYWTLLTGQLRRAEFTVTASRLRSILDSMLETSKVVLSNDGLRDVLNLVLRLGNFLNHGQYNGYAAGFKLASFTRLTEVKSREPGHNFLHFLVNLAEEADDKLLAFLSEIPHLEKAASCSPSDIKTDFDKMNNQINSFIKQLAGVNPIVRDGFDGFLEEVKQEFRELQAQITTLKFQSQRLAEFFCESETFELQKCFRLLLGFFKQLRLCRQEVHLMKKQKAVATRHSNMFTQQLHSKRIALKFGQEAVASSSMMEERKPVVERLLTELHRGNFNPVLPSGPSTTKAKSVEQKLSPRRNPLLRSGATTPERDLELSHISLIGTPMMNRPSSEMFDEELTITALNGPRMVTSSVSHLPDGKTQHTFGLVKAPPVFAIQNLLARSASQRHKGHHRSKSDLASSVNVSKKWIRYQEQVRQEHVQAPLARPESSITLATLNLEAGMKRFPHQQPIALVAGPTIALPPSEDDDLDVDTDANPFVRNGKRGERKSGTLSNFINKISKRVLKQRNNSDQNIVGKGDEATRGGETGPGRVGESKSERNQAQINKGSVGRASGLLTASKGLNSKAKLEDKENFCDQDNPFDRQKKNPIRLSNRFKGKFTK